MSVNLSIKDVPDDLAESLRARARRNHRSIQGELMAMLETHVGGRPFGAAALFEDIRKLDFRTPDESTQWIREDRDRR